MKHWWAAARRWWITLPLLVVGVVLVASKVGTVWGAHTCCSGDLWLSRTPDVKEAYVEGFVFGLTRGAPVVYIDSFVHKRSSGGGASAQKSLRTCMDRLPQFSHGESTFYVDAITEFYKKYPADRWLYPWEVLLDMADPPGLTIDQIHAQIKERHHP